MLVVKIELWPAGNEGKAKELYRLFINRTGSSEDGNRGDYHLRFLRKHKTDRFNENQMLRRGNIYSWPRKTNNVWLLLQKAIQELF